MDDFAINGVVVQHVPLLGTDGKVRTTTRVRIMVGSNGPFTKDFPEGQDSLEVVNAWKQNMVNYVRGIHGT